MDQDEIVLKLLDHNFLEIGDPMPNVQDMARWALYPDSRPEQLICIREMSKINIKRRYPTEKIQLMIKTKVKVYTVA